MTTAKKESRRTPGGHLSYYVKRTTEERRSAAQSREIKGEYQSLAILVRGLMGWYGGHTYLSVRQAATKTGVNNSSLAGMSRGDRGSYESICKLALGFGVDPNEMLIAAGYLPQGDQAEEIPSIQPDIVQMLSQENSRLLEQVKRIVEDRDFLQTEINELRKELAAERLKLKKIVGIVQEVQ